jgi:hypothetical protein
MPKKVKNGYRVDVLSVETETYETYSGGAVPLTLGMATSLATHLKRSKAGGRVVEMLSGRVIDEWERTYTPNPTPSRERVQALRDRLWNNSQK